MVKLNINIGKVIGVIGINGFLKIETYLFDKSFIKKVNIVFNENDTKKWKVKYVREHKKNYIFDFNGISNRNEAELLINTKLFIKKRQMPRLKNEEYYPSQLLGFQIITLKNETIGLVKNIKNFGAGNLLEVLPINNKTYYIPMNDENIKKINFNQKVIIVNPIEGIIPQK